MHRDAQSRVLSLGPSTLIDSNSFPERHPIIVAILQTIFVFFVFVFFLLHNVSNSNNSSRLVLNYAMPKKKGNKTTTNRKCYAKVAITLFIKEKTRGEKQKKKERKKEKKKHVKSANGVQGATDGLCTSFIITLISLPFTRIIKSMSKCVCGCVCVCCTVVIAHFVE